MSRRPLTQAEVESLILDTADRLEEVTTEFADISDQAANAEADYKLAMARTWLGVASSDRKMTTTERQMRADLLTNDALRRYKVAEAQRAATREALLSYRARIDALRTVSANVRAQT
jgi:hypothetical protein